MAKTRKLRSLELARTVARGPCFLEASEADAVRYRLWMSTWVLPELVAPIPELKTLEYHACGSMVQVPELPGYSTRA